MLFRALSACDKKVIAVFLMAMMQCHNLGEHLTAIGMRFYTIKFFKGQKSVFTLEGWKRFKKLSL